MSNEDEEMQQATAFMRDVVVDAIDQGWLRPIPHGYCWYCQTEGPVLDVMAHKVPGDPPSQPPRCEDCFIEAGLSVLSDPEIMNSLLERSDSIEDWLGDDGIT